MFNRIHVEDIAGALAASMERPRPGAIYNVTDNEPAPPQDIVAFAARLMGVPVPPDMPFERAALADGAQLLWREQARLEPATKRGTRLRLRYPTYREALERSQRRRRRALNPRNPQAACRVASAPKWPI